MPLKTYGLALRRHRFRVSDGGLALVKERLETFAAAFLADPCRGAMGIAGGLWHGETGVVLSVSRRGEAF